MVHSQSNQFADTEKEAVLASLFTVETEGSGVRGGSVDAALSWLSLWHSGPSGPSSKSRLALALKTNQSMSD